MLALKITGIIVLIIAIIMLIPVGVDLAYMGGEFSLSAKICGFLLKLIPKKPKDETKPPKEKKPKKEKAATEGDAKDKARKKLNFSFDEILGLIKSVLKGFGKFGRKLRVDRFYLHYIAGGKDPYAVANTFGYVNAALNALAPICAQRFTVKDLDVLTDVDFLSENADMDFGIALTIRIGHIFGVVFTILFGALAILIKNKLRLRREKKQDKAGEAANAQDKNNNNDTIETAERKDANG